MDGRSGGNSLGDTLPSEMIDRQTLKNHYVTGDAIFWKQQRARFSFGTNRDNSTEVNGTKLIYTI